MKKITFPLLLAITVLTGCSSFKGLASERYDGRVIEKDSAAILAYQENQVILGEEKDALNPSLPDFFFQEPLTFVGDELFIPLSETPVVVGDDVPQGRYMINRNFTAAQVTIADETGETLFNYVMTDQSGHLELNLYDGMQLTANQENDQQFLYLTNSDSPPPNVPVVIIGQGQPVIEEGDYELNNGAYYVGTDLEAGSYEISLPLSYGNDRLKYVYIFNPDHSFQVIELLSRFESKPTDVNPVVTLEDGQFLYIQDMSSVLLSPI